MKRTLSILMLVAAAGAGTYVAFSDSESVAVEPTPTLNVWFMDGTNWPESDEWTNVWTVTALTATDVNLPLAQWLPTPATLESYQGHLAMVLTNTEPTLFCGARFEPKDN